MANPLLDMPLLLGHSARIVPSKEEETEYLKFANTISDSSEADLETLRVQARKSRVIDTSSNVSYDEAMQKQRLKYIAALELLQKLGLKTNQDAFVYTPIHFRSVRLKDSDRVRVVEYWRDQCYTLYSYAIHEYRCAVSIWSQQARNCVNDSCNIKIGSHLREFFPMMTEDGLLTIASKTNRAYVALGKCHKIYRKQIDEGASDLAVLAQCGDIGHLTSLRRYLKAFIHEVIVMVSEFKTEDPCDINDEMDLHAHYAQCVSKNYAYLSKADPTWFPPDRQTTYQSRVSLRATTWKTFAQILASRHELLVLQTYVNPRDPNEFELKSLLVDKLGNNSMSHIHQPIDALKSEVDAIEESIDLSEKNQLHYSPDETALRLYVSMVALKLIDTYHIYKDVFDKKPKREVELYDIPATSFEFTLFTPEIFEEEIGSLKSELVLKCGSLSFSLSTIENHVYFSTLILPSGSDGRQTENLLGDDINMKMKEIVANREEKLMNRSSLRDGIISKSASPLVSANIAYEIGVVEERVHFMRDLMEAQKRGMTIEEVIARFDGIILEDTYKCYDEATQLLDLC